MLHAPELYRVLKFFRIFCIAGLLPIEVDLGNWELTELSTRKKWLCAVGYILFVLHGLYKIGSLAYVFLFVPDVQLHQLIVHGLLVIASAMIPFWYYTGYIYDPSLFAAYYKTTIQGDVGGSVGLRNDPEMQRNRKLMEYSLQDLLATSLPYTVLVTTAFTICTYVYDPSMRLLLYTSLPGHLQTWATFVLCLLEELRFIVISICVATTLWQLQLISCDLVSNRLQGLTQLIKNGSLSCRSVCRHLRSLELYVSMLNDVNRYVVFTWKLASITGCIVSGYAAIAHFREHPVFGTMYYAILINVAFIYTVLYEKAFKVPQLFQEVTRCSLLHFRGGRADGFRRQILSIPPTGIKVGHFHKMERASTLIFMDYVLTNIVSMLVAYG